MLCFLFAAVLGAGLRVAAQDDDQITKTRRLVQTAAATTAAEAGNSFHFDLVLKSLGFPGVVGTLKLPSGTVLPASNVGSDFVISTAAANAAALNATYGSGAYVATITIGGSPLSGTVHLGADAYPTAPLASNFAAAQAIDATADFDVQWAAFPGGTADDFIRVRLLDSTGGVIVEDSYDGTQTSYTIYTGNLSAGGSYHLELTFMKVQERSDAASGFSFTSAFASTTMIPLVAKGSGGGSDTTPPTLAMSIPGNLGSLSNAFTAVAFQFSEKMNTTVHPVAWAAYAGATPIALDPAKFTYIWGDDGATLACLYDSQGKGWPAGATVTWTLPGSATQFRDVAGNALVSASGIFQTTTPVTNCDQNGPVETAGFGVFKFVSHLQTSAGAPGADTNQPFAEGFSRIGSSTGRAAVEYPADPAPKPHQLKFFGAPLGGTEIYLENFATPAALDAAYPAGNYDFQLRDTKAPTTVLAHVALVLGANGTPPVPHFANFAAAQAADAAADFTLSWDAFAGVSAATDYVSIEVDDEEGNTVFRAPDNCAHRTLAVTATSIVIPKGTLAAGKTYSATLSFFRINDRDKLMPTTTAKGVFASDQSTRMALKTTGGVAPATAPILKDLFVGVGGKLDLTVVATTGHPFTLESTASLGGVFTKLLVTNPPAATFHLLVPVATQTFYRGRSD